MLQFGHSAMDESTVKPYRDSVRSAEVVDNHIQIWRKRSKGHSSLIFHYPVPVCMQYTFAQQICQSCRLHCHQSYRMMLLLFCLLSLRFTAAEIETTMDNNETYQGYVSCMGRQKQCTQTLPPSQPHGMGFLLY